MNRSGIVKGGLVAALFLFVSSYLRGMVFHGGHDHGMVFPHMADRLAHGGGGTASGSIVAWIAYFVIAGLVIAWLYAVARARLGAGPMTGVKVGLTVVVIAGLWPLLASLAIGWPMSDHGSVTLLWVVAEMTLAGVVAGKLYTED